MLLINQVQCISLYQPFIQIYIFHMEPERKKDYLYYSNNQDLDEIVEGKLPKKSQFMEAEIVKSQINQCYVKQNEEGNLIDTRRKGNYKYPNSAIGLIKKGNELVGTGFLIRDNIVMTCAHNFYCRQTSQKGQKYQGLTFHIGGEKEKRIIYKIKNQNVYYPKEYETAGFESGKWEEKFLYDYAVFKLQNTTDGQYGTLGVKFCTQVNQFKAQQNKEKKVTISGYPKKTLAKNQKQKQKQKKEKGRQQNSTLKKEMQEESQLIQILNKDQHIYHQEGYIKELDETFKVFKYKITTTSGQSGSPIFKKDNGKYYVRGIHVHGDKQDRINRGVILDNVKRNQINIWIGQSTGILEINNQNWLQVLETQEFKIITQLRINRTSAKDFSQITQQKILGKLTNLQELQIGLQLNHFSQIIKTCNKIKSLKQVTINIIESNSQQIQTQYTDQIEESNYLCRVTYQNKDIIKVIKILQKKYIKNLALNLQTLDLKWNKITQLPKEIGNLLNLQTLDLSQNTITHLPIEIGNLLNLQTLNFFLNQITKLPKEIGNLVNLQTLDLSLNRITQLPIEIGNLLNLQTLDLSQNTITHLPIEIGNLNNLQTLNLSQNRITHLPIEIGNLLNLQTLNLYQNRITHLPIEIGNLLNLQTLNFFLNQITQLPIEIGNLNNLQTLNLKWNTITHLPIEIGNLLNLQTLDLSQNTITHLPIEIGNLLNLQTLNLYQNRITQLPMEIGNLLNLQTLNLSQNRITHLPIEIGNLNNLQTLNLKWNKITQLPSEIGNLVNLQTLNLYNNQITQLPMEIGNLVNLQTLNLQNNQITQLPIEIGNLLNLQQLYIDKNLRINIPFQLLSKLKNILY